jgi:hypothetical protein
MESALAAEGARVATERARARVEGARAEVGAAPAESAQAEVEVSSPFRLDEFTDVHAESPFGTRSSAERAEMDDEGEVEAELRATMEEAARADAGQPKSPSMTTCSMPSRDLQSWKMLRGASWCKSGR